MRATEPRLSKYLHHTAAKRGVPLSGTFELSPCCNMDCRMCYVRKSRKEVQDAGGEIPAEKWLSMAEECRNAGTLFLLLTGGEPFLYPGFRELYQELAKMGFMISINTNGTMITEDTVSWLKENPPARMNITLYGASNKTYERLCRNPQGYTQTVNAVRMLKQAGISVKLNASMTPYNISDLDGIAILSKKKIDAQNNWSKVVEAKETGEVLEGKVIEAVKGGVIVYSLGQKIFIPASQTPIAKDGDLSSLVGTKQKFKIIDIKEQRRRAVGSIRVVAREERKAQLEKFWSEIEIGKHYTGKVKSLTSYGAFVDLGGIDGMVHSSELSWLRVANPKDIVSIGDTLEVFVKDFDREKNRISLGYKTEETNPWRIFTEKYKVDDVVPVTIVSMMPFGAFAQIIPGVDGLIHISQIADRKLASPAEVLKKGQVVDAKIIDIDTENCKVSLSIRALLGKDTGDATEEDIAAYKVSEDAE